MGATHKPKKPMFTFSRAKVGSASYVIQATWHDLSVVGFTVAHLSSRRSLPTAFSHQTLPQAVQLPQKDTGNSRFLENKLRLFWLAPRKKDRSEIDFVLRGQHNQSKMKIPRRCFNKGTLLICQTVLINSFHSGPNCYELAQTAQKATTPGESYA